MLLELPSFSKIPRPHSVVQATQTQTPILSLQNITYDHIARKRGQLLRRARGRDRVVEAPSNSVPAPTLTTAPAMPLYM